MINTIKKVDNKSTFDIKSTKISILSYVRRYIMVVHERLRKLRIEKGLSQQELADMIGASKSLISCYENGKRN